MIEYKLYGYLHLAGIQFAHEDGIRMAEIIVTAVTPEAVVEVVQGGADAVCIVPTGLGEERPQNQKRDKEQAVVENREIFTVRTFRDSVEYCKVRGVRAYLCLESFPLDGDMERLEKIIRLAVRCDMDAIVLADMGLFRLARKIAPEMPAYAGLGMNIHNAFGAQCIKTMGFSGVFLAPEMTARQVELIKKTLSAVKLIVTVHGRVCTAYGGTCKLTEMLHWDAGSAYECGMVCEMRHGYGSQATDYPLTGKERCLISKLDELREMGIEDYYILDRSGKDGRAGAAAEAYSKVVKNREKPDEHIRLLQEISLRGDLTEGGWSGLWGKDTFGTFVPDAGAKYLEELKKELKGRERRNVPVRFAVIIRRGVRSIMAIQDDRGNTFKVQGEMPVRETKSPLVAARVKTQLYNLENTPYYCDGVKAVVDENVMLPADEIIRMRTELLEKITQARGELHPATEEELQPEIKYVGEREKLRFTISVASAEQLSMEMLEMAPEIIFIPIQTAAENITTLRPFLRAKETEVCVSLPPVVGDDELRELNNMLFVVKKAGIKSAQVDNLGQYELAKRAGFEVIRAGMGFSARSGGALKELKNLGFSSVCLSYAVPLRDVERMVKTITTEIIAYGRVPLMYTRGCLIKNKSGRCCCESENHIVDDKANVYPLMKNFGCRNVMLSAEKIFMGGLGARLRQCGATYGRLNFTTENSRECLSVMQRYMRGGSYEPNAWGTGIYLVGESGEEKERGKRFKEFSERLWEKRFRSR